MRTPPTPGGWPLVGHTVGFAAEPFQFVADMLAEHGVDSAVGLDLLGIDKLYVLAHPDHFERAFVTERDAISKGNEFDAAFGDAVIAAEGDEWRTQRAELDPFFRWERVTEYAPIMRDQVERRLAEWPDEGTVSAEGEMKNLTLDVIFATILGRELRLDGDERMRTAADGLNGRFAPQSWVLPSWVPTPSRRRFDKSEQTLREEVRKLVETADKESLTARLADALGTEYPKTVESMENQLVGMIFAGHETTALALMFALYSLATNPEPYERAVEEVSRVVGDGPVSTEALENLPVLERIIKETLRLYPPVHTLPRETTRPFSVGDRTIPAETDIHLSIIRVQRDDRWYDDPDEFRPERWEKERDRPRYAYVPFGAGPRSCLGRAFALTEAKIVLASVLRDFHLEWGRDEPLDITPEMTTQPVGDTPLAVRRR
ncbi:cytochrome P450 [Haloferax elongans ATCC BAA-1513]|uniref:Cytochrome P450 n=1 Tax=Haloferax elongans ATCC BAA-1513 TaxID=1230453 RepID=M0HQF4_HALEO|nr:cytochrome P450 [Haloferax elongans]ELZ85329.1 cytochrome P450 [Haloferax elongans ATCC BAA-1513]